VAESAGLSTSPFAACGGWEKRRVRGPAIASPRCAASCFGTGLAALCNPLLARSGKPWAESGREVVFCSFAAQGVLLIECYISVYFEVFGIM